MSQSKAKSKGPTKNSSIYSTLNDRVLQLKNKRKAEAEKSSKKIKQTKLTQQNNIDFAQNKLKADILKFNEDGFIVIETDDIEYTVPEISISEGSNLRRTWKDDPLKLFFSINSISMFSNLCGSINGEMIRATTTEEITKTSHKYYKKLTITQLLQFIGLFILIENKFSKSSKPDTKKNFAEVKNEADVEFMV